jgi:hypothetical protein
MGSGGGRLAKSHGRPANFCVSLARGFLDMCLHEKRKAMVVEKVNGRRTHWSAGHMARPASHHLASYRLGQVDGAPPLPCKYPRPVKVDTHTPHFVDSTCKALFPSVVVRHSLIKRVARL